MPTPQPLGARKSRLPAAPPRPAPVVDYPDLDVEPMTPAHWKAMLEGGQLLLGRYANREDVCVGGEMTMYYQENDNRKHVSPDLFVAFGPSRDRERRVWKVWEEGKLADFVLEVASKGTHRRDLTEKHALYESLGVAEYWQYDPTGDYLPPRLLGHRLNHAGAYEPVPMERRPDGTRRGESKVLSLHLCLDDEGCLRLYDPATGKFLATNEEKDDLLAEKDGLLAEKDGLLAEKDGLLAEKAGLLAEERRARQAAQAEIEELKRRLARQ